jgi:hypothetical protein
MNEFFDTEYCDRCHSELRSRTTSWFNQDTICLMCSRWEDVIISSVDRSRSELEGRGTIPSVDFDVNWGSEVPDDLTS